MITLWKRIKLLEVRKDSNQTKMDFYAVLIPTLLSREIFKNNREIKELIDKLKTKTSIKDYLYDSRTALIARIIREIQSNADEDLVINIKVFKEITLNLLEQKELIHTNEVTNIINRFSRNNKEEKND
ncbi:hypothetical protein D3C76_282220 [compost metagenome]